MRNLIASTVVVISFAGFATSTFAAQIVTTKTTPTVKSNQPQPPVKPVSPTLKGNGNSNGTSLISKGNDVGKRNIGDSTLHPIQNLPGNSKQKSGDLNSEQQLKIQMQMDEYTKVRETISNVMKKESDTKDEISGNLK